MLNKLAKYSLPALIALSGFGLSSVNSYAKPEYSKKEKKGCTYCHVSAGKKDLNDVGKCYGEHDHSLASCSPK